MILDDANFCARRADVQPGIEFQCEHRLLRPVPGENPGSRSATSGDLPIVHAPPAGGPARDTSALSEPASIGQETDLINPVKSRERPRYLPRCDPRRQSRIVDGLEDRWFRQSATMIFGNRTGELPVANVTH